MLCTDIFPKSVKIHNWNSRWVGVLAPASSQEVHTLIGFWSILLGGVKQAGVTYLHKQHAVRKVKVLDLCKVNAFL